MQKWVKFAAVLGLGMCLGCASAGNEESNVAGNAPNTAGTVASGSARPASGSVNPEVAKKELVLGSEIYGISFLFKASDVHKVLGQPNEDTGAGSSPRVEFFEPYGLSVAYAPGGTIVCLAVSDPHKNGVASQLRTREGIGIGSEKAAVEKAYGAMPLNERGEAHYPKLNSFLSYDSEGIVETITMLNSAVMPME